MKTSLKILSAACMLPLLAQAEVEQVQVQLDPFTVRNIGGVTQFDRAQYITIHESFGSTDMSDDDLRYIEDVLEAEFGRDGGTISWLAEAVQADPNNPDMPDVEQIKTIFDKKFGFANTPQRMNPTNMEQVILCTHPEIMHGHADNTSTPWGPRSAEATAEFTAQLLKHGFTDASRPKILEVYNEPFVKAKKIPTTIPEMCEQHNVVAKRVKELNPDVIVGGYSAAWVEFESGDFHNWTNWQKQFMDIAGENMDFWSYHIYDGVNVVGTPASRTGSNSEAIMDIVDSYSHIKFGVAKPIMITEYGKIPQNSMNSMPYSKERSAAMLYSAMGQLMTYMDHPDRLMRTIPFFLGKATWTYGMTNEHIPGNANPYLLWRKLADETFVETDLMKFYYFWKGVEGEWRQSHSSNPDVRVHLLADGKRLNVILMNLDEAAKQVNLTGLTELDAQAVRIRSLTTNGKRPILGERPANAIPTWLDMEAGDVVMLMIELEEMLAADSEIREHRVYATDYLHEIEANQATTFTFENVPTGDGTAILRFSPGRGEGKQVLPDSVRFNGTNLAIPTNWAGDSQEGRPNFFGMLEFQVPMSALQETSVVEIVYPDSGGKAACAVLQVNRIEK
ncbi:beta-agarase [Coraliomargarita akajimensis]|uniref:Beta-agarase n=1 Tax=Coraliomargarita akajimensis (strain DSM 45221 / IAM 15411 / JCM 23193 / KCTC 12865 / 04OKA010-24) TaxID=583355 RepID=D5EN66_CORAD|nr:beta-agarase [Coraliomargarita akajimensis]ADE53501.1 Beta-agarase [Coraliomargarita akajimensis DSM 45221]